jgi:hypothetical protein
VVRHGNDRMFSRRWGNVFRRLDSWRSRIRNPLVFKGAMKAKT